MADSKAQITSPDGHVAMANVPPLSPSLPVSPPKHHGESSVIWTLWLTYGAFYFCRTNISSAVPGLKASAAEGGLGLTGDEVGWILASLKIAYGVGQLVNGQLSERVSPRVMLAAGMFGSAALNVLFGLGTGFYFLLFVWASNGFLQSLGWTPCVRVAANWIPVIRRGNAIGVIGTGYQITLGLTYLIASQSAEYIGWRGALYVPALLLSLAGLFMLFCLRDAPENQSEERTAESAEVVVPQVRVSLAESLYWTLYNPSLWLLGLTLGLLNACRYGFLDWGVAHLMETQTLKVGKAGLQFFVIAIGATAGSYLAGWATDRFFGSRRAPVVCVLMALLGCLSLIYDSAVRSSAIGTMLLLVVIGFCIYGPQVLLVGTAPADLAHRGTSAAAAGFVNFIGYMGAATGDVVTGYYQTAEHGGWQTAIYIWSGWAFAGAAIAAIMWNTNVRRIGVFPAAVPRLAGLLLLCLAGVAATDSDQPYLLQSAAVVAVLCVLASFRKRPAAAVSGLIAVFGVIVVFISIVRADEFVSWGQVVAMVSYGLAVLASLMILVEGKQTACESL